jgi:hypothetical protein
LIENQDEFQESFMKVPYSKTLLRLDSLKVARLSQESKPDLEEGLATTDENLQNLKNSFKTSIDTLKTRRLNPLMNFNTKCHQPGKDIFGRLAKLDERLHKLSNDGNAFGSMQFLGGFGSGVPLEADSLTWFKALECRRIGCRGWIPKTLLFVPRLAISRVRGRFQSRIAQKRQIWSPCWSELAPWKEISQERSSPWEEYQSQARWTAKFS